MAGGDEPTQLWDVCPRGDQDARLRVRQDRKGQTIAPIVLATMAPGIGYQAVCR